NETIIKLQDDNKYLKSILGDNKNLDTHILSEGIQKFYDLQALKPYHIELINLQDWRVTVIKRMITTFDGRDASGKGG
ncbi:polyphosphate kinase 2, partial [Aliarcobacter butzleri]